MWTRRTFLGSSISGSILAGSAGGLITHIEAAPLTADEAASALGKTNRETLKAAMDEIIPAGGGMPAASQVGGIDYLAHFMHSEPGMGKTLRESLEALDQSSRQQFGKAFGEVDQAQRVAALQDQEKQDPTRFAMLRDCVYEAYYTRPEVWKLIGYEFYATDHQGPHMKPFDEAVLEEIRKKPKYYREA